MHFIVRYMVTILNIYILCVCVYLEGASEKQRARTTRITRGGQKKVEIPGQKDGEKDKGCRAALNNLSVPTSREIVRVFRLLENY